MICRICKKYTMDNHNICTKCAENKKLDCTSDKCDCKDFRTK